MPQSSATADRRPMSVRETATVGVTRLMVSKQDTRSLVKREFPGRESLVERAYRENRSFRDLCGDYRDCAEALERWRRSEGSASFLAGSGVRRAAGGADAGDRVLARCDWARLEPSKRDRYGLAGGPYMKPGSSLHAVARAVMIGFVLWIVATAASAQDLTPRAYWPTPNGTKVAIIGYSYVRGDVLLDPSVPLSGVDSNAHTAVRAICRHSACGVARPMSSPSCRTRGG